MKARNLVVLLVALAIGLGGWSMGPEGLMQPGAMSPGVMSMVADAATMAGGATQMDACETCESSRLASGGCNFVCAPTQFIAAPTTGLAFAVDIAIPPLPSSQRPNGLTPTPSPPPPRPTILV